MKTAVPCATERDGGSGDAEQAVPSAGGQHGKVTAAAQPGGPGLPPRSRDVLIVLCYVPLFTFLLFCSKEIGLLLALY